MATWYAQADASWTSAQWNDQADGQGTPGAPTDGDTADANGHAIRIGADALAQFLTFANGTFTFTADYTLGQGLLQGTFTIASGATMALGAHAYSLEPGWVLNVLGLLTLAAGGTLDVHGALLGNVSNAGTINFAAGLAVFPAGTLQIKTNQIERRADIDWPANGNVLNGVAFDHGAKAGTYDADAALAEAVAAQYAEDQATVLANAEVILSGHAILDQAGTYQPEPTGDLPVTIPEDLRELYDEARAQLIVEAQRTPKNWAKLTGYASILRAIIADGQVEQVQ
jgi:hypothetical protein